MFSKSDWRRRPTAKTIAGYVRLTKAALSVCVAVAVFCGNGCKKKSETEKQENKPSGKVIINAPLPGEPILRIHWLGKKRIAAETNSASLLDIWDLPESLSVQSRFLDQLALAPWRLLPGNTNYSVTNAASILLRPLLDDILENEVYLEVSRLTNQPPELALSVKLDASRAALWQTSLPAIWNSLSAATNLPGGKNESAWPQGKLEVRHSGDWTLIGIGRPDNPLLKMLEVTIRANTQLAPGASRLWLEGDIMMSKLARKPAWLPLD